MTEIEVAMQHLKIHTEDKFSLAARHYPAAGKTRAVVLMPTAMGVKQDYYGEFAAYLAGQGFAVVSFDYRGMGASIPAQHQHSLRGFEADVLTWAEQDYSAALRHAKQSYPDLPLFVIGHSLGGQLAGLTPAHDLIDGMITVGSGLGYWRENAKPLRRKVWLLWYFLVPLYLRMFGYFPGKKLRKVGNLPKGVMQQWSHWCRHPAYFVDKQGATLATRHHTMAIPILALSFTDDEMMGPGNIHALLAYYSQAEIEHRSIAPAQIAARRIGHMGFFRREFQHSLWSQALEWLHSQSRQYAQK